MDRRESWKPDACTIGNGEQAFCLLLRYCACDAGRRDDLMVPSRNVVVHVRLCAHRRSTYLRRMAR